MRVGDHRKFSSEVDSSDKNWFGVAVVTLFTRKVNPRIEVPFDVFLESISPFDILSVCGVFGDQRPALLPIQFERKLSARFYRTFTLKSVGVHRSDREPYQGTTAEAPTSTPISLTVLVRR